jgi:hypothetical protein
MSDSKLQKYLYKLQNINYNQNHPKYNIYMTKYEYYVMEGGTKGGTPCKKRGHIRCSISRKCRWDSQNKCQDKAPSESQALTPQQLETLKCGQTYMDTGDCPATKCKKVNHFVDDANIGEIRPETDCFAINDPLDVAYEDKYRIRMNNNYVPSVTVVGSGIFTRPTPLTPDQIDYFEDVMTNIENILSGEYTNDAALVMKQELLDIEKVLNFKISKVPKEPKAPKLITKCKMLQSRIRKI